MEGCTEGWVHRGMDGCTEGGRDAEAELPTGFVSMWPFPQEYTLAGNL